MAQLRLFTSRSSLALAASGGLAYLLNTGVDEATVQNIFGTFIGGYVSTVLCE